MDFQDGVGGFDAGAGADVVAVMGRMPAPAVAAGVDAVALGGVVGAVAGGSAVAVQAERAATAQAAAAIEMR